MKTDPISFWKDSKLSPLDNDEAYLIWSLPNRLRWENKHPRLLPMADYTQRRFADGCLESIADFPDFLGGTMLISISRSATWNATK